HRRLWRWRRDRNARLCDTVVVAAQERSPVPCAGGKPGERDDPTAGRRELCGGLHLFPGWGLLFAATLARRSRPAGERGTERRRQREQETLIIAGYQPRAREAPGLS